MGCLGVMHIPKTGGSALRTSIAALDGSYTGPLYFDALHFGSPSWVDHIPPTNRETIVEGSDQLRGIVRRHQVLIGHFHLATILAAGCTGVAFQVREPRARILSLYRYWQAQPQSVRDSWGGWGHVVTSSDLPLAEFLRRQDVVPAVRNAIATQVLGQLGCRPREHQLRPVVDATCRALGEGTSIVEWSVDSERFLERICQTVGTPNVPALLRENVTRVVGQEQVLDVELLGRLHDLTDVDRPLLARL